MTWNETKYKSLIDSRYIQLRFSNPGWYWVWGKRNQLKNEKLDLWCCIIQSRTWTFSPIMTVNPWNSQKAAIHRCFSTGVVLNILQYSQHTGKHLCLGLLLRMQGYNFRKKRLQHGCFLWYCKIFKYSFFIERLWWLLLIVLPKVQYSQLGCLYFDFVPPHTFDQKLKMLHKQFFPITTKTFFAFLNWSSAFDFRIFVGKTLYNFFQFWSKTYTKHCTNNFVHLYFAVDQVLSFSRYNLENGRMLFKQKYWIKKIWW